MTWVQSKHHTLKCRSTLLEIPVHSPQPDSMSKHRFSILARRVLERRHHEPAAKHTICPIKRCRHTRATQHTHTHKHIQWKEMRGLTPRTKISREKWMNAQPSVDFCGCTRLQKSGDSAGERRPQPEYWGKRRTNSEEKLAVKSSPAEIARSGSSEDHGSLSLSDYCLRVLHKKEHLLFPDRRCEMVSLSKAPREMTHCFSSAPEWKPLCDTGF